MASTSTTITLYRPTNATTTPPPEATIWSSSHISSRSNYSDEQNTPRTRPSENGDGVCAFRQPAREDGAGGKECTNGGEKKEEKKKSARTVDCREESKGGRGSQKERRKKNKAERESEEDEKVKRRGEEREETRD